MVLPGREMIEPPQPVLDATVIRICRSSRHGRGSSHVPKNSQCDISSRKGLFRGIGLHVLMPTDIAKLMTLVNNNAPGTIQDKETQFPISRCNTTTVIVFAVLFLQS